MGVACQKPLLDKSTSCETLAISVKSLEAIGPALSFVEYHGLGYL